MTRPYWRRRTSGKLSATGLILSLGLILTANGFIKSEATQQEPVSVECAEPAVTPPRSESRCGLLPLRQLSVRTPAGRRIAFSERSTALTLPGTPEQRGKTRVL